ncbi:serine kinase/phosphatase [Pseudomonas huanghezhanensis]|uniref:serine kinase/phosphatase n=1 Tax=Pseudomonas huanghezhanensis TaxID=3002903 RepID=UPI0022864162|nr:serine kinase/phosphatase [Pseudomonas sp. BSw22131]
MTDERRPLGATQPEPIDTTEDQMGSMEELNFNDNNEPSGRIGDTIPADELETYIPDERAREAGMTGASTEDHEPTDDDMSPETLIHEDGARSAREQGEGGPADSDLSIVDEDEIGAGGGLDEEEEAIVHPLDGKP